MAPRDDWLREHNELTAELADAITALAETRATEHQARIQALASSQADSVSGRDRDAQIASYTFTADALRCDGTVRALEARLLNLRVLLDHWSADGLA